MRPDLVAFQEAVLAGDYDQAADVLGAGYHLAHQTGRAPDGAGISIGSRLPLGRVRQVDLGHPSAALVADVLEPRPFVFVNHKPAWEQDREGARELQTETVLAALDGADVVLAGDLDASPDAPSARRLRDAGYRDAWTSRAPGHTFEDRRIDYVFVRGAVEVADCRLVLEGASDHLGVLADLTL